MAATDFLSLKEVREALALTGCLFGGVEVGLFLCLGYVLLVSYPLVPEPIRNLQHNKKKQKVKNASPFFLHTNVDQKHDSYFLVLTYPAWFPFRIIDLIVTYKRF
jgi:hypothetical protein